MLKMKTKNNPQQRRTWLSALTEAARQQHFELPAFDVAGMGALRSETTLGNRFATLKRHLRGKTDFDGVVWALWQQAGDTPMLVAAFRDALEPEDVQVGMTLNLLKGWLVDQWTVDDTRRTVGEHPGVQTVKAATDFVAVAH
jgi:hypothetical protein